MEPKQFRLASVFWGILILVLSLVSFSNKALPNISYSDKIIHFVFYFVLIVLILNSFISKSIWFQIKIILLVIVYGIIIEVLQELLTKTRSADLLDVLANTVGVFVGFLLFNSKINNQILKNKK